MDLDEALSIIDDLAGDEHAWVDLKEDYEIGGIGPKKAEFIRDVSSLANTITDSDYHYIFVGVEDDGDVVGVLQGSESYDGSGPRHIFSYDESDIQEIIDSNLDPSPKISWHTFEEYSEKFGVLVIDPLSSPPTVTSQHINDSAGNRLLHKGLVFVRKGSGKKIAGREELERIVQYRIEMQREQILDGVHKAVDIGPEWIDRIGEALPEEPGLPIQTAEDPEEADVAVTERITREPASTLDEQLNEDIAQWRGRGDDFIDHRPMYQYYANPGDLRLDDVALEFLTQTAIKNSLLGIFWLHRANSDRLRDIILRTPDKHHRIERSAEVLLLRDDRETFEELLANSSADSQIGVFRECRQKFGSSLDDRVSFLLNQDDEYTLKHQTWRTSFNPVNIGLQEIMETIPELANQLVDLQELRSQGRAWNKSDRFRDALWDLEIALGAETIAA